SFREPFAGPSWPGGGARRGCCAGGPKMSVDTPGGRPSIRGLLLVVPELGRGTEE
ncbi:hypothetical protein HTZ77_45065, partial [Nonomuraea sp. SMC257]|nr:hypothetical protein [Nonomuraea montanisoli]